MRIVFIADSRSSHTQNWVKYFVGLGDEVLLLSTYPAEEIRGLKTIFLPGIFRIGNIMASSDKDTSQSRSNGILRFMLHPRFFKSLEIIWQQVKVFDVIIQTKKAKVALRDFNPDIVHALRIQNEGYISAFTKYHPLIISSWGSDFIYTTKKFLIHRILTRCTMNKPDAFISDCLRDIRLAHAYGLPDIVPTKCFPGNGGIDTTIFHSDRIDISMRKRLIIYTRGFSPMTRLDTLFKAYKFIFDREQSHITQLLVLIPEGTMPIVEKMIQELGLSKSDIQLRAFVSQEEMAHLLQTAAVFVSPMLSDGTPNSMLQAMACGAFPVISDLESIREWISHSENGLLFNPNDPEELALCLKEALDNISLRKTAQKINLQLINDRADYIKIMPQVRKFYQAIACSRTI
jgi:glycosyltransferase involved in cell wall biosynthesis